MRSLSITGHWDVSLPSGVSPWNSIFGPGRRSKYNNKTSIPFPVQNGSSSVQNGNSSVQNGNSSVQNENSSVQNGNSSVQNGKIIISINIKNIL